MKKWIFGISLLLCLGSTEALAVDKLKLAQATVSVHVPSFGVTYRGTGVLITPNKVLTAKHCFMENGKFLSSGYIQDFSQNLVWFKIVELDKDSDLAIITLELPLPYEPLNISRCMIIEGSNVWAVSWEEPVYKVREATIGETSTVLALSPTAKPRFERLTAFKPPVNLGTSGACLVDDYTEIVGIVSTSNPFTSASVPQMKIIEFLTEKGLLGDE